MPISMHRASVPVFSQMLNALAAVLDKGAEFAARRKIDEANILATRLFPDMLPLSKQVQLATDHAKGAFARLAGVEIPKFDDVEQTFADLKARLAKTVAFGGSLDAAAFEGSETRDIKLMAGGREMTMKGDDYLFQRAMPNFYFHVTTAYDIFRHLGVELGKADFVGR